MSTHETGAVDEPESAQIASAVNLEPSVSDAVSAATGMENREETAAAGPGDM